MASFLVFSPPVKCVIKAFLPGIRRPYCLISLICCSAVRNFLYLSICAFVAITFDSSSKGFPSLSDHATAYSANSQVSLRPCHHNLSCFSSAMRFFSFSTFACQWCTSFFASSA